MTAHAIERADERFDGLRDDEIPTGIIQLVGMRKDHGDDFRVRSGKVVFKCVRYFETIRVVTVVPRNPPLSKIEKDRTDDYDLRDLRYEFEED